MRDQASGYYSAAVLDFDDNSIEATYREKFQDRSDRSDVSKDDQRVLSWQKDVARSSVGNDSQVEKPASRVMINNITTPTTVVSRLAPVAKEDGDMSAKALVGTLLGAAAGAFVAYTMTKGEEENLRTPTTQTITYQTIEANNSRGPPSVLSSRRSYPPSGLSYTPRTALRELEYPSVPKSAIGRSEGPEITLLSDRLPEPTASAGKLLASTLIDTFIPPSEIRPFPPHRVARGHTDSVLRGSSINQPSCSASGHPKTSHASSAVKTVTQADPRPPLRSPAVTEIKLAEEVPLPSSRATSHVTRRITTSQPVDLDMKSELRSVAPSDSVSQAGSKRSKGSKRSARRSRSRSGMGAVHESSRSRVSDKTIKAPESKSRRRESAISLPLRPSSNASVHRSVKSFVPGF